MAGKKVQLKNQNNNIYPYTQTDCVFDGDGNSLEQIMNNLSIPTSPIRINYGSNSATTYSKVGRIVYVNVYYRVSDGTIASWSSKVIATLPEGYRPYGPEIAYAYGCTDGVQGVWCEITSNGEVKISTRGNAFDASSERVRATLTFISES